MLASCSGDMDYSETNTFEKKDIEAEFDYVGGLMATIYRTIDYDYGQNYSGAMLASATDESEYAVTGNTIENYYNGAWSPTTPMKHVWTNSYQGITYCNLFLDQFTGLTFDDYEINDDYYKQMHRYNDYQYEARWARAYFYFQLARHYGGVPIVTKYITPEESNTLSRNTSDEVFDYIISECDAIKDSIIRDHDFDEDAVGAMETGRVGKLAVLALKAEAALYKASPLFNPNDDKARWKAAAKAQQEVIDSADVIGVHYLCDYEDLWETDNYWGSGVYEIIFGRRVGDVNTPESYNYPVGIEGGKGGNCPTQTLVEAYEEGDKRKDLTIAKNGDTKWPNTNSSELETFYGGKNGQPLSGGTPTGYYLKKLCHGDINLASNSKKKTDKHTYVLYHLSTFWLNYAEAVFKCTGSPYEKGEFKYTPAEAVNMIRKEHGGLPALPTTLTNDEFWEKYKNERFVDLAFEGHRYYDVRRWKEADKHFRSIKELKLTRDETTGEITSTVQTVSRQWDDKMYLAPISQADRQKNPNLSQNPGW